MQLARTSVMTNQHGAIIVRHGKIIARSINKPRNDPSVIIDRDHVHSVHAEIAGLRVITRPARACVYVARWSRRNVPAYSRPCVRCLAAMERLGVHKIIFTE